MHTFPLKNVSQFTSNKQKNSQVFPKSSTIYLLQCKHNCGFPRRVWRFSTIKQSAVFQVKSNHKMPNKKSFENKHKWPKCHTTFLNDTGGEQQNHNNQEGWNREELISIERLVG